MIEDYVGQVVDLKSFSDGAHFKNSSVNEYFIFEGGDDGYWVFRHESIKDTYRMSVPLILPKATVGFAVIGIEKNYRKQYTRYSYDDHRTMDRDLAIEWVLRGEFDLTIDSRSQFYDLFAGKTVTVHSHGQDIVLNIEKLQGFMTVEQVD